MHKYSRHSNRGARWNPPLFVKQILVRNARCSRGYGRTQAHTFRENSREIGKLFQLSERIITTYSLELFSEIF